MTDNDDGPVPPPPSLQDTIAQLNTLQDLLQQPGQLSPETQTVLNGHVARLTNLAIKLQSAMAAGDTTAALAIQSEINGLSSEMESVLQAATPGAGGAGAANDS